MDQNGIDINNMANPIFSIIVLNYNRLKYSKQTIEDLLKKTTIPFELILVDNGSDRIMRDYLFSIKNKTKFAVKFAFSKYNLGVSGGRNRGAIVSNSNSKLITFLDDDILLPDKWDIMALEAAEKIDKVGIIGVCVENKEYPIIEINGVSVMTKSGNINGGCMIVPRTVFGKLGYFQTNYLAYGRDDTDLDFRAKKLGFKNVYIVKKGIHLDKNDDETYAKLKRRTHQIGSKQDLVFDDNVKKYELENNYFVPYIIPKKNQKEFDLLQGNLDDVAGEKRLAVITTTMNCERIIIETLKSVALQNISKNRFIHIIVDLGSSDKTKDICKRFIKENEHVGLIELKEYTPALAYNHLIYDYIPCNFPYVEFIAFLDSGDLLSQDASKEIIKEFDKKENAKVGAFYSGFSIIDERNRMLDKDFKKSILVKDQLSEEGQEKLKNLFVVDNPCRYVKAFRLEFIYNVGGFKQKYPFGSEYHMFGRMLSKHYVAKIDKVLYMLKRLSTFKPNYKKTVEIKKIKKEFFNLWDQRKKER